MTGGRPLRFVSVILLKLFAFTSAAHAESPFARGSFDLFRPMSPGVTLPMGCNSLQPYHFANLKENMAIVIGPADLFLRKREQLPESTPALNRKDHKTLASLLRTRLSPETIAQLPIQLREPYRNLRDYSDRYKVSLESADDVKTVLSIIEMNPLEHVNVHEDDENAGTLSGLIIADSGDDTAGMVHAKMGVDLLLPLTRNEIEQRLLLSVRDRRRYSAPSSDVEFENLRSEVQEYGRTNGITFTTAIDVARVLAILELQKQYPKDRYHVTGNIGYYQPAVENISEDKLLGVLDVVVFDKFTCQAELVAEVRLSPLGARSGLNRLRMFADFLSHRNIREIGGDYSKKFHRAFPGEARTMPKLRPLPSRTEAKKRLRRVMDVHSRAVDLDSEDDYVELHDLTKALHDSDLNRSRRCRGVFSRSPKKSGTRS